MAANPDITNYIRQRAAALGIDPDIAVKVAGSEALNVFDPSKPDGGGDGGSSFGPFQLHYGGMNKAMPNPGLGDEFTRATGLKASDPSTWQQQVDFALNTAKRDGWRQWMGAANSGIDRWQGIGTPGVGLSGRPSTNVNTDPGAPGTIQPPLNGTLTVGNAPVTTAAVDPSTTAAPATDPAAPAQGQGILGQLASDPKAGISALANNKDFAGLLKGLSGAGGSGQGQGSQPNDPIIQTGALQSMQMADTSRMANASNMFNQMMARRRQFSSDPNSTPGLSLMG